MFSLRASKSYDLLKLALLFKVFINVLKKVYACSEMATKTYKMYFVESLHT